MRQTPIHLVGPRRSLVRHCAAASRSTPMHSHSIDDFRHAHMFLGEAHERNERKVWIVIAICAAMMALEIVGGVWFGSGALIADGLHMSNHPCPLLIAALSSTYVRRYAQPRPLAFGNGN